jgi:electron transfer flavoprotein beta subunit
LTNDESGLRIAVLVKQVIDPAAVAIDAEVGTVAIGPERVLNTYDAYGLSTAVDLKEAHGGTVTAIAAGGGEVQEVLLRALAIGADAAVRMETGDANALETLDLARCLSLFLTERWFDLVIAGQSTEDYESGQVGVQVAELLDLPHVSLVTDVALANQTLTVNRDAEGTKEVVAVDLPAVLVVLTGRNGEQRYPTLRGMMAARKKGIEVVPAPVEGSAGRLAWTAPRPVERESTGILLEGVPAEEAADQLVTWLKEKRLI